MLIASISPSLSVTTAIFFWIQSAISRKRKNDTPTEITSIPSSIGKCPSLSCIYAFWITSSSESPSHKIAFLHNIIRNVSYPATFLKKLYVSSDSSENFVILRLSSSITFPNPNLFVTKLLCVEISICFSTYCSEIHLINWFNLVCDKWFSGSSNKMILAFCEVRFANASSVLTTHCSPFPT